MDQPLSLLAILRSKISVRENMSRSEAIWRILFGAAFVIVPPLSWMLAEPDIPTEWSFWVWLGVVYGGAMGGDILLLSEVIPEPKEHYPTFKQLSLGGVKGILVALVLADIAWALAGIAWAAAFRGDKWPFDIFFFSIFISICAVPAALSVALLASAFHITPKIHVRSRKTLLCANCGQENFRRDESAGIVPRN